MAQNLIINGTTFNGVSSLSIPKTGGGNALYPDTSDANATASDILAPKTAYVNGVKVTGTGTGGGGSTPTGTINITSNGTVDVTNYASANVNVSGGSGGNAYYTYAFADGSDTLYPENYAPGFTPDRVMIFPYGAMGCIYSPNVILSAVGAALAYIGDGFFTDPDATEFLALMDIGVIVFDPSTGIVSANKSGFIFEGTYHIVYFINRLS